MARLGGACLCPRLPPASPGGATDQARPRKAPAARHARGLLPGAGLRLAPRDADLVSWGPEGLIDSGVFIPILAPWLLGPQRAQQAQLEASLAVTRQQTAEAEGQLQELQQRSSQIQSSAHTMASTVSGKVTSLLQALKRWEAQVLEDIEVAKTQALAGVQDEEQRVRNHLEALAHHDRRARDLLEQSDDQLLLQDLQLPVPPGPLGPLSFLQWDEDLHVRSLKDMLSQPCGRLLHEGIQPGAPAEPADVLPTKAPGLPAPVWSPVCPLRRKLWQNYRNLTFDPDSANRHFCLSRQAQQVKHCRNPQGAARPSSFELWQVQCVQSFHAGRHYWEVQMSDHSVTLGVAYPALPRREPGTHTDNIGRGSDSWGLCVQEDRAQAWHDGRAQPLPQVSARLLGVDLDVTSGCLTFYSLEPETRPLHAFYTAFTQPLCPVFWLLEGRALTLCHQPAATLPPEPPEEATQEGVEPGGAEGPGQTPPNTGTEALPRPPAARPEATAPAAPASETGAAPGAPGAAQDGAEACEAK
ncbi:PREDICTED: tripartite motif-containing protein 65 [Condylura cristata]|uniref:tripartite motif-containing protein 65 n=1 Tax=Condylura cristata TaxID=143302 RepID=UPI000642B7C9|nr:PREDICTED: tripartite motif-containing protein 65 [Condylura cristata]